MASKKRKLPKNIQIVQTGAIGFPEKRSKEALEQFMNSSHSNKKSMEDVTKDNETIIEASFEKAFTNALKRTHFEEDEISIYRHGVIIRPKVGAATKEVYENISKELDNISGGNAHIVQEDNTFSVRINVGTSRKGNNIDAVRDNFSEYTPIFERIRRYLEDEYGDVDWFTFWDTEESMAMSG